MISATGPGKGGGLLERPTIEKTTPGRESEFDLRYIPRNYRLAVVNELAMKFSSCRKSNAIMWSSAKLCEPKIKISLDNTQKFKRFECFGRMD